MVKTDTSSDKEGADPAAEKGAGSAAAAGASANSEDDGIKQVWTDKAGGTHATKKDAVEANRKIDMAKAAETAIKPIAEKIDRLAELLGSEAPAAAKVYKTNADLPAGPKKLPEHGQDIYRAAFNSAFEKYQDEEKAHATAWAAVKNKYEQDGDGNWKAKAEEKGEKAAKSLYDIGRLAELVQSLDWMTSDAMMQAMKGDGDELTVAALKPAFAAVGKAIRALLDRDLPATAEAAAEMAAGLSESGRAALLKVATGASAALLKDAVAKIGARHSAGDRDSIQKMHDMAVQLGAACAHDEEEGGKAANGDLAKLLEKITGERDALSASIAALGPKLDKALADIELIKAQPAQGMPPFKTDQFFPIIPIGKNGQGGPGGNGSGGIPTADEIAKMGPMERQQWQENLAKAAIAFAHTHPVALDHR